MKKTFSFLSVIVLFALVVLPAFASDPSSQGPGAGPYTDYIVLSQQIGAELSFAIADTVLAMSQSIPGLTGGSATAGTTYTVITSNSTGYKVELNSIDATGRMVGPVINGESNFILAYAKPGTAWSPDDNTSSFGYATGSANIWWGASATPVVIETSPYATDNDGVTTALDFKVELKAAPSPAVAQGTYYATTTLTATML